MREGGEGGEHVEGSEGGEIPEDYWAELRAKYHKAGWTHESQEDELGEQLEGEFGGERKSEIYRELHSEVSADEDLEQLRKRIRSKHPEFERIDDGSETREESPQQRERDSTEEDWRKTSGLDSGKEESKYSAIGQKELGHSKGSRDENDFREGLGEEDDDETLDANTKHSQREMVADHSDQYFEDAGEVSIGGGENLAKTGKDEAVSRSAREVGTSWETSVVGLGNEQRAERDARQEAESGRENEIGTKVHAESPGKEATSEAWKNSLESQHANDHAPATNDFSGKTAFNLHMHRELTGFGALEGTQADLRPRDALEAEKSQPPNTDTVKRPAPAEVIDRIASEVNSDLGTGKLNRNQELNRPTVGIVKGETSRILGFEAEQTERERDGVDYTIPLEGRRFAAKDDPSQESETVRDVIALSPNEERKGGDGFLLKSVSEPKIEKASSETESRTDAETKGKHGELPEYLMDYYSRIYSENPRDNSATILSRACERPTSSGRAVRFELPRRYLEERTGVRFHEGKLYHIRGRIESRGRIEETAWNFEIHRVGTEHLKLRIYLPKEYHSLVTPGDIYKVAIDSIEEKEIAGSPREIARIVRDGASWSRISNRILEVGGKEVPWRKTAQEDDAHNQSIVSAHMQNSEVPATYGQVEVDERTELRAKWMDWKTVAAWIDTEGYLYTKEGSRRRYELMISQSEIEPLNEIHGFLRKQGIEGCSVKWTKGSTYTEGGIYQLRVKALGDLDRIVSSTEPFLITSIRNNQFQRYRERRQEATNIVEFKQNPVHREAASEWVDWKVLAAWIDAEGNLGTRNRARTRNRSENKSHRDYCLSISQKERAPLENICSFLNREGINAKIFSGPKESHLIAIRTVSDLDRVVTKTEPFLMTDNKRLQYEEYRKRRMRIPKRGPRPKPFSS